MARKTKILVVDDDRNIINALRRQFRSYADHWHFVFALGGVEAVKVITREEIDIVISDMRMPEVDGSQLLEWISEHQPHIVRVVLSGEAKLEKINRIVGKSHRFLSKPCSSDQIIAVVKEITSPVYREESPVCAFGAILDEIKTPPSTFMKLQNALNETEDIHDIRQIVSSDPGLSIRILQLCYSSYFKKPLNTCNIGLATSYIGIDRIRELMEAGRLGQQCRIPIGDKDSINDANWLAHEAHRQAKMRTDNTEPHDVAYTMGLVFQSSAVVACCDLQHVANKAVILASLFGFPRLFKSSALRIGAMRPNEPTDLWPILISDAVIEQHGMISDNEVAA